MQQILIDRLESCSYNTYIVVSQPSVSIADFSDDANSAPHLQRWAANSSSGSATSSTVYTEVLGAVDSEAIVEQLQRQCKGSIEDVDGSMGYYSVSSDASQRVVKVSFPPPPTSKAQRVEKLQEYDLFLHALVKSVSPEPHLIIYTTTPTSHQRPEHHTSNLYDQEDPFHQGLHLDLKRDFEEHQQRNASLPLFETYQYFTPAIFTAILVSIVLFLMLYVGISAVAGVEVSYFAFSKEMGPAAQKKQQQ